MHEKENSSCFFVGLKMANNTKAATVYAIALFTVNLVGWTLPAMAIQASLWNFDPSQLFLNNLTLM